MSYLRTFWRVLKTLAMAAVWWAAIFGTAWAKKPGLPKEDDGGSEVTAWTMPYGLVVLGIALGMLFVCRSSRRRDRARPEAYDQKKLTEGGKD